MKEPVKPLAFTIKQVCAQTNLSSTSIYDAIRAGKLPAYKFGRRTLVKADDLSAFIDAGERIPPTKVREEAAA